MIPGLEGLRARWATSGARGRSAEPRGKPELEAPHALGKAFRVGDWWVRRDEGMVERNGQRVHLKPQQMDLLVFLATERGRLVSKEEIFERVWHGAIVEEVAIPRCISELRKALGDDAREPRYIQTVPRRGYRLVARVREAPRRPAHRRLPGILAAAGLAAALALALWLSSRWSRQPGTDGSSAAPAAPQPAAVAVLELRNLSGDPGIGWLSTALAEMLSTELARSRRLSVVPSWMVAGVSDESLLGGASEMGSEPLRRLRLGLGADYAVTGSYLKLSTEENDRLRLDLRLWDCEAEKAVATLSETGSATEIFDLVALSGRRLRQALHGDELREGPPPVAANPVAARLYFEGLAKLRRFEAREAKELLERSIGEEPEQPMAHLALAEAWSALGYEANARRASARALELASHLSREQRLWIEARHLTTASRWEEAIEVYRALWVFSPQNLELGLELAKAQNAAGEPLSARRSLEEVRERAGAGYRDPARELAAAESALLLGEHEQALVAAAAAAELGARRGAEMLIARARHLQGRALHELGRVDEAVASLRWASTSYAAAGDRRSEAYTRITLAGWREDEGDFDEARKLLRQALAVFEGAGDRRGEAKALGLLGSLLWEKGNAEEGRASLEQAIGIHREIGNLHGEAKATASLAIRFALRGDHRRAGVMFERTLAIYEQTGNRELAAVALINLGKLQQLQSRPRAAAEHFARAEALLREIESPRQLATLRFNQGHLHLQMGELERAGAAFSEAETLFRHLKNPRMLAASLNGLGGVATMRDELDRARELMEEALALRLELGDSVRIVDSRTELAVVLLETGELEAAESMARAAVREAETNSEVRQAPPLRVLATVLLERGRLEEAAAAIAEARHRLDSGSTVSAQLLSIAAARLDAASDSASARAALRRVIGDAGNQGAWGIRAEAVLELAAIELRAGDRLAARARLSELASEARDRGQLLILRKALSLTKRAGGQRPEEVVVGQAGL